MLPPPQQPLLSPVLSQGRVTTADPQGGKGTFNRQVDEGHASPWATGEDIEKVQSAQVRDQKQRAHSSEKWLGYSALSPHRVQASRV